VHSVVRSLCLFAVAAGAASGAAAQKPADPRDALVVSTAWLAQHLKDPDLVVLFLGDDNEYNKGHIPGAHNVQLEDFTVDDHSGKGLMMELPSIDHLRASLGAFGITDRSRIVVYSGRMTLPYATRMLLTLDYAGFGDRSSLLDGGSAAWLKEGRPVTDVVPPKRGSALATLRVKPVVVNADYVKAHAGKPGVSIVDGRAAAFYDGVSTGSGHGGPHRTGHIAGAKSVPFVASYASDETLRPSSELRAIFTKAGIAPGDTVIGYCHIGQQATAMLFAARVLGHPVVLYDGSFEDWSKRPAAEFSVEATSTKGKP
jgi:thiosulfate/3-mercaptopyruvate sulfurtransferase